MGALYKKVGHRYLNTYTGKKIWKLSLTDKISDILLTHSRIDNQLLNRLSDYFRDSAYYERIDKFFKNAGIEIKEDDILSKLKKKCSKNATKNEIAKPDFLPIWNTLSYYIFFDYSGQAKYIIETELQLTYSRKIALLKALGEWKSSGKTCEILYALGDKRNEVVHSDIIEGLSIKKNDERLRRNEEMYKYFKERFGEVTPDIRGDIEKAYESFMKKYESLSDDIKNGYMKG